MTVRGVSNVLVLYTGGTIGMIRSVCTYIAWGEGKGENDGKLCPPLVMAPPLRYWSPIMTKQCVTKKFENRKCAHR